MVGKNSRKSLEIFGESFIFKLPVKWQWINYARYKVLVNLILEAYRNNEKKYLTAFPNKFRIVGMLMKQTVFGVCSETDGRFKFRALYLEFIPDDDDGAVHLLM